MHNKKQIQDKKQLRKQLQKLLNTELLFTNKNKIYFKNSYTRRSNFIYILDPNDYIIGDSITIGDILAKGFGPYAYNFHETDIEKTELNCNNNLTGFLMKKYVEISNILNTLDENLYLDEIDGSFASVILTQKTKDKKYQNINKMNNTDKIDICGIEIIIDRKSVV